MALARLTSTKRFTALNVDVILIDRGFHISYEFEESMHYNFLGSEGLQGTHMNAFKIDDKDPKGRFVNLFGDFSPLCATHLRCMLNT